MAAARSRLDSDHNPIRMQKVLNRGTLSQKLRVRCNVIVEHAALMKTEVFAQLRARLHRDGALFNDQAITLGALRNGSRQRFDRGQICIAVRQRRGTYADKNRFSPLDAIIG